MKTRRLATLVVALSLVPTAFAAPAVAADEVGLSRDGRTWHDSLSEPLFAPDFRWVPGDRETASFYVRNRGPSAARMSIDVTAGDADRLLAESDIEIDVRAGGGDWHRVPNGGTTKALVRDSLAESATTDVDVRVDFAWLSPNRSQRKALPLRMVVTLVQSGPVDRGPSDQPGGGLLPGTGADVPPWLLWLAAVLLGVGGSLWAAGRKERSHA